MLMYQRIGIGHLRPNRSVEIDTQRQGAARHADDRTPRGALPLCAAHLQRYVVLRENRFPRTFFDMQATLQHR